MLMSFSPAWNNIHITYFFVERPIAAQAASPGAPARRARRAAAINPNNQEIETA
jgi:hypothetical protein